MHPTPSRDPQARPFKAEKLTNCNYSATFEHVNWGGLCFEGYGTVLSRAPITSSVWVSSGKFAWDLCD
ncbi:hypothetical protein ABNF97_12565 [Plantactinospora sp. B6F1]|uniref:hypothetical protein n=1 Tax=Plantactinospora sp. B6F1 TaxID=3158971 RepID=UPI00102B19F4